MKGAGLIARPLLRLGGTRVWVLPNPSGLNAHYRPPELARLFAELRETAEAEM